MAKTNFGCDLIFELDAKYIDDPKTLRKIRKEIAKLLKEVWIPIDFPKGLVIKPKVGEVGDCW